MVSHNHKIALGLTTGRFHGQNDCTTALCTEVATRGAIWEWTQLTRCSHGIVRAAAVHFAVGDHTFEKVFG